MPSSVRISIFYLSTLACESPNKQTDLNNLKWVTDPRAAVVGIVGHAVDMAMPARPARVLRVARGSWEHTTMEYRMLTQPEHQNVWHTKK